MSATNPILHQPDNVPRHRDREWRCLKRWLVTLLLLLAALPALQAEGPGGGGRRRYGAAGDPFYRNPQPDYWAMWRSLKMTTDSLLKTFGATNAETASLLRQIQTNAQFLEAKWDAWFKDHNQPGQYNPVDYYLVILRADSRRLGDLKKEKDGTKVLETVREVALDLQLKADNCRHSADGLGKDIRVKVHTKAGENEVGGFEVFYVPRGMLDIRSAHERFPRLSSPTKEQTLSPGRYALWVKKKTFTSEPTVLSIGGNGETELDVDLTVPVEP